MELTSTLGTLQAELEQANASLKGVDESIKRFLGRDPNEPPLSVQYVFLSILLPSLGPVRISSHYPQFHVLLIRLPYLNKIIPQDWAWFATRGQPWQSARPLQGPQPGRWSSWKVGS
jgi:hypothetical protein